MKKEKYYEKLCSGCGLCKSIKGLCYEHKNGFDSPKLNKEYLEFLGKVCPANGINFNNRESKKYTAWGEYINVYRGYSLDENIRYNSASGGVITSIACYLLSKNYVDGILHIKSDGVLSNKLVCSKSVNDIISCSGSLYIDTHPLEEINKYLNDGKKYAFIGKPCDIEALENYILYYCNGVSNIEYKLTFFCGGSPSMNATEKLINSLNIDVKDCQSIKYRGNGWPGKTTVLSTKGKFTKEYIDSWNNYFGRDCRYICRFCLNGTGICGDISCGDLWELKDKKPDFSEKKGMNIIFSRSTKGEKLLKEIEESKDIYLENYSGNISDLEYIQPYQYNRRISIYPKILALNLFGKPSPKYKIKNLRKINNQTLKSNFRTFLGTCKRIIRGNIK